MRGTYPELDPLRRAVVHALEQTWEDAERFASGLRDEELFAEPYGLSPVVFHLRHMVRSLDRLLSYAEDRMLGDEQLRLLAAEKEQGSAAEVHLEFREGIQRAVERVRAVDPASYDMARGIGRKRLPTTVGGLLIHCAEHTQRHAGQMVLTAKLVRALAQEKASGGDLQA